MVASSLVDTILVYQRETGSNKLKFKNEIQAIVGLDNFSVGDDGYIYVGGHSDPWVSTLPWSHNTARVIEVAKRFNRAKASIQKFLVKSYFPKYAPPSSSQVIRLLGMLFVQFTSKELDIFNIKSDIK